MKVGHFPGALEFPLFELALLTMVIASQSLLKMADLNLPLEDSRGFGQEIHEDSHGKITLALVCGQISNLNIQLYYYFYP